MSVNQSTKTIFQAGGDWLTRWSAGNRRRFAELAAQRNDAHHYDEALLVIRAVLWICIGITLSFGVYFHYSVFSAAGGNTWVAVGASLLLFLVAEMLKVVFGQYTIQAIVNGVAFKMPITNLLLTACFATLTIGAFSWSIHISTKSVESVNLALNTAKLHEERPFVPPSSIATLDVQIAAADAASAKAQKSTWKKRPTAEGLAVMQESEKTKQGLIAQRQKEWDAAWSAHQASLGEEGKVLGMSAATLGMIGGNAEYVAAFLLLIIALLRNKCYHENLKQVAETTGTPSGHSVPANPYTQPKQDLKHQFSDNAANRRPIGFRLQEKTVPAPPLSETKRPETVVTTAFQPVSGAETKVLKQTIIRDDIEREVAEQCRNIQRYFSKWEQRGKGGGRPETILANLAQFFKTISELQQEGDISAEMNARVVELHLKYQSITTPQQNQQP